MKSNTYIFIVDMNPHTSRYGTVTHLRDRRPIIPVATAMRDRHVARVAKAREERCDAESVGDFAGWCSEQSATGFMRFWVLKTAISAKIAISFELEYTTNDTNHTNRKPSVQLLLTLAFVRGTDIDSTEAIRVIRGAPCA